MSGRPTQFASKLVVGTTGLVLCSNDINIYVSLPGRCERVDLGSERREVVRRSQRRRVEGPRVRAVGCRG